MQCRFCGSSELATFCDLGTSPLSNSFLASNGPDVVEKLYPLHAVVCSACFLVQLPEVESAAAIFSDYAYFSSYSQSWLDHARRHASAMAKRLSLSQDSLVVELASNDGYLLQYFKQLNVPVLGIEPAANVAAAAEAKGVPTLVDFFGRRLARSLCEQGRRPDLLIGNNVLAHVPNLNDFVAGIGILLKETGIVTMEFPHVLKLIQCNEFDTIYHEHFSYFSMLTVEQLFAKHGMEVFEVEELPTHGGSLRIFARHAAAGGARSASVEALIEREVRSGLKEMATYARFNGQARRSKRDFLRFLIEAKEAGKSIAAYGAAAKGNTLLNFCGVRTDFIDYVVDLSEHKQGKYLPGTRIPVFAPARISETKPDYLVVLCWNLADEVMRQMSGIRDWGGRFVLPIPHVTVL
jgi:predicted TPR repeat methyltransferase